MQIELTATVSLHEDVQLRRYPQGHLVCSFGSNQAFEVDGVGALILYNLNSPVPVGSLIEKIAEVFGTPAEVLQDDLLSFIAECLEMKILRFAQMHGNEMIPRAEG